VALGAPFESVLIANRGEIAVRVARTCRAMGMRTIAIYSDADVDAPHVRLCDTAVRVGPPPARESYLRIDAVIGAAIDAGARAVHPGYGFLSENPAFVQACVDAGLVFVGPGPDAMRTMGDKIAAKKMVEAAGVPTVPGYLGEDQSNSKLAREAARIGVPVLIKAAAGGGGKGMRVVRDLRDFDDALEGAKREAAGAFGDDRVFLERYLDDPRHIEVQILADAHGRCIHLGERECSIQRRHQKIVEETPSVAVSPALRAEMGAAAVRIARAVRYVNAGTMEFMLAPDGRYYFLEMNTRLQVEHPVTELVTGFDLVREQLGIAAGRPLSIAQDAVTPRGHAIEVRVYAEDPDNGFLPSIGRIESFGPPQGPGLRNDSGVVAGSVVSMDYDPMLAKLIAFDRTRNDCIERLIEALDEYDVTGVTTNIRFLRRVVDHQAFRDGRTTTGFIDRHFGAAARTGAEDAPAALAAAAALQALDDARSADVWARFGSWRHASQARTVRFEEREEPITVEAAADGDWHARAGGATALVRGRGPHFSLTTDDRQVTFSAWPTTGGIAVNMEGRIIRFSVLVPPSTGDSHRSHRHGGHGAGGRIEAPMSGKITKVNAKPGDRVAARQAVVVMEAMKMEHSIVAPYDGTIEAVSVKAGDTVAAGDELAKIEADT
jgi:3-methylcrotonyl-CoA carboxylase alpha subunit